MTVNSFLHKKQLTEIDKWYQNWKDFLAGHSSEEPIPDSMYRDAAIQAYVLGHHAEAIEWFRKAAEVGFPPNLPPDEPDDAFSVQWSNYQEGMFAFELGLAASIAGLRGRSVEILTWSAVRLCDTELVVEDRDETAARVGVYRTYAMLAVGQPWLNTDSDLDLGLKKMRDATDFQYEWGLPITLGALVLCRRGEISRSEATNYLTKLIQNAKGGTFDKLQACFHVLYLQSAFPDVFEPVLTPLVTR